MREEKQRRITIDIHSVLLVLLAFFFLLIIVNILYLDILFFRTKETITSLKNEITRYQSSIDESSCPSTCVSKIDASLETYKKLINERPMYTGVSVSQTGNKEAFITFGSGTNATDDWTDVAGLQSYIDTQNYPSIKSVVFEASLYIPTGNETAFVRLYNMTDKHPVWNSELSLEGGVAKLLTSPSITLDPGKKLYQVQMKTSLKYPAQVTQSRIRITTK